MLISVHSSEMSRCLLAMWVFSYTVHASIRHYTPVLRDFGEDAGFAGAGAGTKRDNANDVVGSGAVGADEGSARVAHAGRPALAGFAEANNVIGKAPVLSKELTGTPDSAGDLMGGGE